MKKAYLQDDHGGPLTDDKALSVSVKRSGRFGRVVIVARGQTSCSRKSSNSERMDAGLGAASQHHICITVGDEASRIADRVRSSGTRRGGCVVGAL